MARLIGITGGIGSGKSFYARMQQQASYSVYDTDSAAKRIAEEEPSVRAQIVALLGEEAYAGGTYQTAYVAKRVFDEEQGESLLQRLNAIIHPAVRADLQRWQAEHAGEETLYVESALLFESGLNTLCDEVVCVTAPEDVCIARVMARDHVSKEDVRARMARQMSDDERQQRSDRVYLNI